MTGSPLTALTLLTQLTALTKISFQKKPPQPEKLLPHMTLAI